MKFFNTLFNTDFLLKKWKVISIAIGSLIILCLVLMFVIQVHSNLQKPVEHTAKTNLTKDITFENLKYKIPDFQDSQVPFLKDNDKLLGSYKSELLFATKQEGLYFYNLDTGKQENVTDSSLFSELSNNEFYFIKNLDEFSNDLMRYNIETKKTEEITNVDTTQQINGVAGTNDVVYYILNDKGKNYLTAYSMTDTAGKMMANFYIPVPNNSYLVQEGEKIYLIDENGQFLINVNKLEKIADTPSAINYSKVQVWNGKTLIEANNEIYYKNKVVYKGKKLLDVTTMDSNYLLINDNNSLLILEVNNSKTKLIRKQVIHSAILNENIILSVKNPSGPNDYFLLKKL